MRDVVQSFPIRLYHLRSQMGGCLLKIPLVPTFKTESQFDIEYMLSEGRPTYEAN